MRMGCCCGYATRLSETTNVFDKTPLSSGAVERGGCGRWLGAGAVGVVASSMALDGKNQVRTESSSSELNQWIYT